MDPQALIDILKVATKLKTTMRHCWLAEGRQESVADHSWRIALMAMLLESEFPDIDINKVIKMCLIHDLGEAFTGDIPTFIKTNEDALTEDDIFQAWINQFPEPTKSSWQSLLEEMNALETNEAKMFKALDKIEALMSHNESDLSTWLPLEYDLQYTYGVENMQFSDYFIALRQLVDEWTTEKINNEK